MINDRPYKKLTLWEKALEMVKVMYDTTRGFPGDEEFGLERSVVKSPLFNI